LSSKEATLEHVDVNVDDVDSNEDTEVAEDVAERVYEFIEFVVVEEYEVVDEVGEGGPATLVDGKGIQFVPPKPLTLLVSPLFFPWFGFTFIAPMAPIITFPRNDIGTGICCCCCSASSPAPGTGLAGPTIGKRNAWCTRSSWMGDCSSDLSGRLGGGTDNVGRDDDECAKEAASTCAWASESVHVGRDLWYDDVGNDVGADAGYDGDDDDDVGYDINSVDTNGVCAETTTDIWLFPFLFVFALAEGFAFAFPALYLPLPDGLGTGRDGEDEATNDDKFATEVDAKKYGIYQWGPKWIR